ncbi:MAG: hypothetical protein LAT76_10390 [Schleiferiaceae bacterium]|nr:hypothetical protein [Schleiferiaceae bacterium]
MKNYFEYLVLFLLSIFLSSCGGTRYQMHTMLSDLHKGQNNEYALETDSLSIAYSFIAEDGHITMAVFNKTKNSYYINWRNSAYILNGQSTPMVHFIGRDTEVIPPSSMVVFSAPFHRYYIENFRREPNVKKAELNDAALDYPVTYRYVSFDRALSPLNIRTRIQLSSSPNFETSEVFDHAFWLHRIDEYYQRSTALHQASTTISGQPRTRNPEQFILVGNQTNQAAMPLYALAILGVIAIFTTDGEFYED